MLRANFNTWPAGHIFDLYLLASLVLYSWIAAEKRHSYSFSNLRLKHTTRYCFRSSILFPNTTWPLSRCHSSRGEAASLHYTLPRGSLLEAFSHPSLCTTPN